MLSLQSLHNSYSFLADSTTSTMKVVAVLFSVMAVATAFAPMPAGRANTELKKSFWDTVSFDRKHELTPAIDDESSP